MDTEGRRPNEPGAHAADLDAGRERGAHEADVVYDSGVAEAHRRFGGLDIPATLAGMLAALALATIIGGIVGAAIGAIGYQLGLSRNVEELSIGGLIAGVIVLFLSFLFGGWVAGRMARYDGGRNGIMTAVWAVILAAVLAALGAALGAEYNVFRRVNLPQWFSSDALTATAIISGIVSLAAMLLGGFLGGVWGERYHRRADDVIATTREGGIAQEYGPARRVTRATRRRGVE